MKRPTTGICVDAGGHGNPGMMFYRGVDLQSGKELFYEEIGFTTNNLAELLALAHGIHYVKSRKLDLVVYSDSQTALAWMRSGHLRSSGTGPVKTRCHKALKLFSGFDKMQKWHTSKWGEIPADFGRK